MGEKTGARGSNVRLPVIMSGDAYNTAQRDLVTMAVILATSATTAEDAGFSVLSHICGRISQVEIQ